MELEGPSAGQIRALEERLLDTEVRRSPMELESLLADDFVEFSRSGSIYDQQQTLEALSQEAGIKRVLTDFHVRVLGEGLVLATYRVTAFIARGQEQRCSLRSSIWRHRAERWELVFHQGTPVEPA